MKRNDKIGIAVGIALSVFAGYYTLLPNLDWTGKPYLETKSAGFAVVELFTSEGCSSCPPADALLAQIQKESVDKQVFLLAYHVDYWDHQNWKDRFSSTQFTARQQQYAKWMKQQILYTPQFVINGVSEFGGDDARTLYSRIAKAIQMSPKETLELNAKANGNFLEIAYESAAVGKTENILIALVQKMAASKVERGENAQKLLHHVQIVHALESVPLEHNTGTLLIKKPQNFIAGDWEIIGFIQDSVTGKINAASKTKFND